MTIAKIDYDYITSTPDERDAIDQVNSMVDNVESMKLRAHGAAIPLIAEYEAWYGALNERQSHWTVPGVVKAHRVDQGDVNESQRRYYAIKDAMGEVTPGDVAPPAVLPPEQKAKELSDEIGDAAKATGDAVKTGFWGVVVLGVGVIIYKILS